MPPFESLSPAVRRALMLSSVVFCWPIVGSGCQRQNIFVPPPPPEVTVALPLEQEIADSIQFTGTTRATATVELRARVTGYLQRVAFTDGANVCEGDLLFVIEQAPFQVALKAAQADLQSARAALQLAEANLARSRQLVLDLAVSRQQLDVDEAQRATAAARVKAAEAALEQAELHLSYTEMRAPISGRIGRHLVDPGNLVHAEQTVLAVIESIDPVYAVFYLSERELLHFMGMLRQKKLPDPDENPPIIYLGLANEEGFPHAGHLDYRELGVDPGTGTVLRRAIFPNPDQVLIPGLFVRLQAPIGDPTPRLLVEQRAIGADQRGEFLLVVNAKNVVEYRRVELGLEVGALQVVNSGVEADDWIVINGLQRARPGAQVVPDCTVMGAARGEPARSGEPAPKDAPASQPPQPKPAKNAAANRPASEAASPSAEAR